MSALETIAVALFVAAVGGLALWLEVRRLRRQSQRQEEQQ
jgi:hypothetical protein